MQEKVFKYDYYQDFIKNRIEQKFGKQIKYSKDCKLLSETIYKSTNRQLSISTIKRFFQLIPSPFKPSRYTLDTFSVYLGHLNWESFTGSIKNEEQSGEADDTLVQFKKNVFKISETSYFSLSHKSRYNPNTFVRRKFAEDYLERFINSGKTATMLIAPTGFGKSALLLQWYNTHFSDRDERFKDDIICLIDGGLFFTFYNQTQENEILNQLLDFDYKTSQQLFRKQEPGKKMVRFFLIIDDVDRIFSVREKYHLIAENIMRLIMINKNNSWFKLILTCRPENLDTFTSLVVPNPLLAEGFYNVHFNHKNHLEAINIPLFSPAEIKKALTNNNSNINFNFLSLYYSDIFNVINTPFFFSFFIHDEDYSVNEFTEVGFLNHLIQRFYFSPPFAEEKQYLIKKFLHLCNIEKDATYLRKDIFLAGSDSRLIYQELIKAGLIYEYLDLTESPEVNLKVRFSNKVIFEYLLTRTLMSESINNAALLKLVFEKFKYNIPTQNALLKWLIKIAFFEGNVELIKQIHNLQELQVNIPNELVNETMPGNLRSIQNTFFECLRSGKQLSITLHSWLAESKLGQKLYFEDYLDMDNLMNIPEESIDVYFRHNNTPDGLMIARYIFFIKAFYAQDYEKCASEFEKIGKIDFSGFHAPLAIGYYFSTWFLYASLTGYKRKSEMLEKFLAISDQFPVKRTQSLRFIPPFEFLVVYNLNVCESFEEIVYVVEHLDNTFHILNHHESCFYQYYKMIYARSLLRLGNTAQAMEIYRQVKKIEFPRHLEHFMKMNVSLSSVDFLLHQKKQAEALDLLNDVKELAREMRFSYFIQKTEVAELNTSNSKKDVSD